MKPLLLVEIFRSFMRTDGVSALTDIRQKSEKQNMKEKCKWREGYSYEKN